MNEGKPSFQVRFLGSGEVLLDGAPLVFPYRKARLLMLMLLEAGRADREVLCARIWTERPDRARANLRNALAALNRILPPGCIVADRFSVRIGEGVAVHSDLGEIDGPSLDPEIAVRLAVPFLDDPSLEGNAWVEERREHYARKLRKAAARKLAAAEDGEKNFWRLWAVEPEEPASSPASPRRTDLPFVRVEERDAILDFLDAPADGDFFSCCFCTAVFGEEGSGKSALVEEIYERKKRQGLLCFRARAREGEGNGQRATLGGILKSILGSRKLQDAGLPAFHLRYLTASFPELPSRESGGDAWASAPLPMDQNPYLLGKIFAALFDRIHSPANRQIMLLLEDAHWGDRLLPNFLRGLLENARPPLAVILTCYPEFKPSLDLSLSSLDRLRRQETFLVRLTLRQTEQICRDALPAQQLTDEKLAEIYEHTGGSPFLLREFLSFYDLEDWSSRLSKSLYEVVHSRILTLTDEESELLDCVAVFPGEAPFDPLKALSGLSDAALIGLYEKLHRKGLLYDRASGSSFSILFRYSLIKKQIREAMSGLKRWNLHRRLLDYFKGHPEALPDRRALSLLAQDAGEPETELGARMEELRAHFEYSHELFPMLSDASLTDSTRTMNDTFLTRTYLAESQDLLDRLIRMRGRVPDLIRHERALLMLQGGYLRWSGNYADAESCLEEALRTAFHSPDREEAVVEVLEQLCYLGIQTDDPRLLKRYVFQFYRSARKEQLHPQVGMALRFLAILNIMEGHYDVAEKLLNMSLRLFEKLEAHGNGYMLSIIAATHYQGDIALHRGRHEEAQSHYLQCVRLCEGRGFYRGLGLHLAKAAWCAVRLGQLETAREHLAFALPLFEGFQSRRGAGLCAGEIVFGLSALFALWDGEPQKAKENLLYADELGGIMQKPLWNAILFCIKALLKSGSREKNKTHLERLLPHEPEHYLSEAQRLFDGLGLTGETEAYEQLRKARSF